MFWGLIMEPHKRYTQKITKAFHISMASLDVSNSDDKPSQVLCGFEGKNYLLCTLHKSGILQAALDLHFEEGTTVSFATNGDSHVHLTGYLTKDLDEFGEEESDEDSQGFEVKPQKKSRSNDNSIKEPSKKKSKLSEEVEEEDDSDDSDVDFDKLMGDEFSEEESDDEEEDEEAEEEEDDEDDDGLEEEDDDDVEEEEISKIAGALNGLDKQSKKGKKEAQATPNKEKQGKEKPAQKVLTPGPKNKKLENGDVGKQAKTKEGKKPAENQSTNNKKTLPNGLIIEDIKIGQGAAAVKGKVARVYYEGRLPNNKVFDYHQKGPGFVFRVGIREVIKGWDIGVVGMKVGGKRRLTVPPKLAYGREGAPPEIPPNATLVFDLELKGVQDKLYPSS